MSDDTAARQRALRRQALKLLISYYWVLGEASSRPIAISNDDVHRQVKAIERRDFPGGQAEVDEFRQATGQTASDVKLQAKAELAVTKLRLLATRSASVTPAEIRAYYASHLKQFAVPEQREARFENRKSKAAAERLKREVEAGKSLTTRAQRRVGEIYTTASVPPRNEYERAIDSAKPHTVAGPFKLHADYWLYEVVRIIPAHTRKLNEVRDEIRRKLIAGGRHDALEAFAHALRARWTIETDCSPEYVVSRCRQYTGPRRPEDPFELQ